MPGTRTPELSATVDTGKSPTARGPPAELGSIQIPEPQPGRGLYRTRGISSLGDSPSQVQKGKLLVENIPGSLNVFPPRVKDQQRMAACGLRVAGSGTPLAWGPLASASCTCASEQGATEQGTVGGQTGRPCPAASMCLGGGVCRTCRCCPSPAVDRQGLWAPGRTALVWIYQDGTTWGQDTAPAPTEDEALSPGDRRRRPAGTQSSTGFNHKGRMFQ